MVFNAFIGNTSMYGTYVIYDEFGHFLQKLHLYIVQINDYYVTVCHKHQTRSRNRIPFIGSVQKF
jgi:hypothetical protein